MGATRNSMILQTFCVRTLGRITRHLHAGAWGTTSVKVAKFFTAWLAPEHLLVHLVRIDSVRVGLAWLHDPTPLLVSDRFAHQFSDLGIQLPTARTRPLAPGTTATVMGTVLETALDEHSVGRPPGASLTRRLASEPGIRNRAVHRLNARADFYQLGPLGLPDKTAMPSICRADAAFKPEIGRRTRAIPSRTEWSSARPVIRSCDGNSWECCARSPPSAISEMLISGLQNRAHRASEQPENSRRGPRK